MTEFTLEQIQDKIIFDPDTIDAAVTELAQKIDEDYKGSDLVLVGVLRGAYVFLSDLSKKLTIPHVIDFVGLSSYGDGDVSRGIVRIESDLRENVADRDVLFIEDIIDTGLTYVQLRKMMESRHAKSVRICALLDKPSRRVADVTPDYHGLVAPDLFLGGYGLDFLGYYRGVPYIFSMTQAAHDQLVKVGELNEENGTGD